MLRLKTILLLLGIPFLMISQASKAVRINLVQSNNNFQLNEIFENKWNTENFYWRPISDQMGLSLTTVKGNGSFYEILLAGSFRKNIDSRRNNNGITIPETRHETIYSDLHFRFEYGKLCDLYLLPNVKYGISASVDPRISYRQYSPFSTSDFPFSLKTLEASINIIPQLSYNINDRFSVVFKLPLEVFSNSNSRSNLLNPNLSIDEQLVKKSLYNFAFLVPNFTIGAGYFISHEARKQ